MNTISVQCLPRQMVFPLLPLIFYQVIARCALHITSCSFFVNSTAFHRQNCKIFRRKLLPYLQPLQTYPKTIKLKHFPNYPTFFAKDIPSKSIPSNFTKQTSIISLKMKPTTTPFIHSISPEVAHSRRASSQLTLHIFTTFLFDSYGQYLLSCFSCNCTVDITRGILANRFPSVTSYCCITFR